MNDRTKTADIQAKHLPMMTAHMAMIITSITTIRIFSILSRFSFIIIQLHSSMRILYHISSPNAPAAFGNIIDFRSFCVRLFPVR